MAQPTTFRQVVYRLLPETPENWCWLEGTLEAQRVLYNAALQERIDCYARTGHAVTYMDRNRGNFPGIVADRSVFLRVPGPVPRDGLARGDMLAVWLVGKCQGAARSATRSARGGTSGAPATSRRLRR